MEKRSIKYRQDDQWSMVVSGSFFWLELIDYYLKVPNIHPGYIKKTLMILWTEFAIYTFVKIRFWSHLSLVLSWSQSRYWNMQPNKGLKASEKNNRREEMSMQFGKIRSLLGLNQGLGYSMVSGKEIYPKLWHYRHAQSWTRGYGNSAHKPTVHFIFLVEDFVGYKSNREKIWAHFGNYWILIEDPITLGRLGILTRCQCF